MPTYASSGTMVGSGRKSKGRSKSRPKTDVAKYLKDKTAKEEKTKKEKEERAKREKDDQDRQRRKRREERQDAERLAKYRETKAREDREDREKARRRRKVKSRSVSPVRSRRDLASVVGRTGGKRGRTPSLRSVQHKPRKKQEVQPPLAGKRGGRHGDPSKTEIERWTQGLSRTTAQARAAQESGHMTMEERTKRAEERADRSAKRSKQRHVSVPPPAAPAPPRQRSPTPAFKEFQKLVKTPLEQPRSKPRFASGGGLAEKEQSSTAEIDAETRK